MDGFEKHIRSNRDQFEDHKANREKMWKHISTALDDDHKVIPMWRRNWFQIAAGIIILLGIVGILRSNFGDQPTFAESSEMLEIDLYYEQLVAKHVKMVYDNPHLNEAEKNEFLGFMDELEKEYDALRNELDSNLDNEKVLIAIIANYKQRIEIIENLLLRINQSKNTNHEQGILL